MEDIHMKQKAWQKAEATEYINFCAASTSECDRAGMECMGGTYKQSRTVVDDTVSLIVI